MRATVGIAGLLGLGFTIAVAAAQTPVGRGAPQRAAILLPPQPLHPSELPLIARAAPEDLPAYAGMTPVTRPLTKAEPSGPGWLNGTDANVRPASGTLGTRPRVGSLSSPSSPKDEQSSVSIGFDKLKGALGGNDRPSLEKMPGKLPPGVAGEQANANTAFRGTAANGAPVYAGPPAYRWYGWGSVTPGANPHAPTGQYPHASANWYAITGATPGAFPVPVMNPGHPPAGTEPPAYVTVPNQRNPVPAINNTTTPLPTSRGASPPFDATSNVPLPADLSRVEPQREARVVPTPTITPPPPIAVPALTPPPTPVAAPMRTDKEPPIASLPTVPVLPLVPEMRPIVPTAGTPTTTPAALPVSVTDDHLNWQPKSESPGTGGWGPAGSLPSTPPVPPIPTPTLNWQQPETRNSPGQPTARGQVGENRPDPTAALIRRMCDGRASGIDVRWTGSKKLTVSFESRSAPDAQQLVKDISARAELSPLQIDFCVLVK